MSNSSEDGRLGLFVRLVRLQFVPVMIVPVILGAASAWFKAAKFDLFIFLLALAGSVSLHLAANAIDDVYDFSNGVDRISEKVFPKDAPGWKPMARGLVSLRTGLEISFFLYFASVMVGIYLSVLTSWLAIGIALPGIVLSYFYTAPPLKLDYRGLGLGELAIFLGFGPIPALGAFYVLTGSVSVFPIVAAIPTGLLTTDVLISHDMIFYDAYSAGKKRSLTVVLGRKAATRVFSGVAVAAYASTAILVGVGYFPVYSLLVFMASPFLKSLLDFKGEERPPPEYGKRTLKAFFHSIAFTVLLAVAFVI